MEIICRCGYHGNQMIEFETSTPSKKLVEWQYSGYTNFVVWTTHGTTTLNWSCPKCGKVLVRQLGGLSYNQPELKDMRKRLQSNSYKNERYLKARKLSPGKYTAKILSIRKVRNKPQLHLTLQLDNEVVIKETS